MIDLEHFNEFLKYYNRQELAELIDLASTELEQRDQLDQVHTLKAVIRDLRDQITGYKVHTLALLKEVDRLDEENNQLNETISLYQLCTVNAFNTEEELGDLF